MRRSRCPLGRSPTEAGELASCHGGAIAQGTGGGHAFVRLRRTSDMPALQGAYRYPELAVTSRQPGSFHCRHLERNAPVGARSSGRLCLEIASGTRLPRLFPPTGATTK